MEKLPFINDFVLAFSWKRANDNMKVKKQEPKKTKNSKNG